MTQRFHDVWMSFSTWFASVEHLGLFLYLAWVAYLIVLGIWIVLQKREPVATLSWILALALLPYFGFIVYHLLGPQRIVRQRLRRARSRLGGERYEALLAQQAGAETLELSRAASKATGIGPSQARRVELLIDGHAKYARLLQDLSQARQHVHFEYYIFNPDQSGRAILDALTACARRGVRVRLLLDAVGSASAARAFFADYEAAGGELGWFHPPRFLRFLHRPWMNLRTHRKIVVIDHDIGYVGGINITDDENDALHEDAYRDLHTRVEGAVVRSLQHVFVEDWVYATGRRDVMTELARTQPGIALATSAAHGDACAAEDMVAVAAQVLVSGPDSSWEIIHRLHVGLIHAARRRVWLVTPYFVPGEAAMMALTSAALGGVDVRLLVPKRSDSLLVTLAARSYFDHLMAAGVKIYEYGPRMLHTKALLVDDEAALIGSANFDHRSFRLNFEASILFVAPALAGRLARLIEGEFASAPRVRDDRRRALLRDRLPEALARLLSPLL
jgi:cardiolipin synthase A/B